MTSSSGPSSSLAAAVDGLLADTVLGVLGPTPSPKRKAPEPVEPGNAEDSAAEVPVRRQQRRWRRQRLTGARILQLLFSQLAASQRLPALSSHSFAGVRG